MPIVTAKEAFSAGDAMRDIYTHGIITTDFVLVMGDLVSNIRIDEVVRAHRERRKLDKDAIMTMVVKEAGAEHRSRYAISFLVVIMEVRRNNESVGHEAKRLSSYWTRKRRNASITSLYRVTPQRHYPAYLARFSPNTQRSISEMTSLTVQLTSVPSR